MRKTLAIVLCAAMIISMSVLTFGVSAAPQGTAINTAADFAAMDPNGNYYLNADITINTTYLKEFKGVFDGNGRTVLVTAPMFAQFDGTVMNLTIDGTEIRGNEDLAAFAVFSYDGMTAINVINKVDITVTGMSADAQTGLRAGGILANGDVASMSVFRNCINYGNITVETAVVENASTGVHYITCAGGLVGRADGLEVKYSENHGKISAVGNNGRAGGMSGFAVYMASMSTCDIVDSTNTGEVFGGNHAGGMSGTIGVASNNIYLPYTITYCLNTGEISGGYNVGGFVGYCYASATNTTMYIEITASVSIANVKVGRPANNGAGNAQTPGYGGLWIGYSNSVYNKIQGCLAVGELIPLTGPDYSAPYRVVMGCSSAKTADMQLSENYIYDNNTTEWYSYAAADTNQAQRITFGDPLVSGKVTRCTPAELSNGSILAKLNAAAGSSIFAQNLATDAYPTIDMTLRAQRAAADVLEVNYGSAETTAVTTAATTTAKPADTTKAPGGDDTTTAPPAAGTTAPASTTAPTTDKKGGCGSVYAFGIAFVALIGSAVVLGKKH